MRVVSVTREHLPRLHALFEAASSSCYCRYWHFRGNKNEWLDHCAHRPEENRAELDEAVTEARDDGGGLVALAEDGLTVLGWMKLTRRAAVNKLRSLPVYRKLALGDDTATMSVSCFLVHPEHRKKGVARALLEGAETVARALGASAIEGYPRQSSEPLHDEEAWQGPVDLFAACGFEHVAGEPPYPVYRKVLERE